MARWMRFVLSGAVFSWLYGHFISDQGFVPHQANSPVCALACFGRSCIFSSLLLVYCYAQYSSLYVPLVLGVWAVHCSWVASVYFRISSASPVIHSLRHDPFLRGQLIGIDSQLGWVLLGSVWLCMTALDCAWASLTLLGAA